jgi:AP-1 complex subunit beta-1
MGCIRVDKITEYLCDPLQRCLKDEDPYVRKTAAVCVAKLYDINAELVEDRGFLDALKVRARACVLFCLSRVVAVVVCCEVSGRRDCKAFGRLYSHTQHISTTKTNPNQQELLSDANPMVVANAVAALAEIQDLGCADALAITPHTLFKLLAALNECTEWGQVFILDALAGHTFADAAEAEKVAERVLPRLQHANSAVVLSAVKVLLRCMDAVSNEELVRAWSKKLAPPLVTLLASEPEVQYVALRSISLIVQRRPGVLANDVRVFFCKYNDPLYVKMEKLEIMVRLASPANVDAVLLELREYAQEVDVDFVRRAVRAVGRIAVALEPAAERCVGVLMELVRSKVSYVVQEAVVVVKDIFRRYANRFESVIGTLCESLDALDEPEAKAAMVWIIGERELLLLFLRGLVLCYFFCACVRLVLSLSLCLCRVSPQTLTCPPPPKKTTKKTRRVRRAHRQRRRAARRAARGLPRGAGQRAAAAAHRRGQALPQEAHRGRAAHGAARLVGGDDRDGQPRPARPRVRLLAPVVDRP